MSHSFLPPSGASAWTKCSMWPTMNRRYPQTESSPEAEEGTAAHWVGTELIVEGRNHPAGTLTPNNLTVTEEMIDGAELLQETVNARMGGLSLHVEEWVQTPVHEECAGTPDYWANTGHSKRIEIIDYKFGHRFVDEYFNPQGLCYAAGILEKIYGQIDTLSTDIQISFTIIQPRCFNRGNPVRTHTFTLWEARTHLNALHVAAIQALAELPVATTNPSCEYCPGRHSCAALQQAAYSDAEHASDRLPLDLSPSAAALELRMLTRSLARLEARVDGLREQTLANIKSGKPVPFFHVEQGYGRTSWNLPDEQIIGIGQLFGTDLSKPGVITPAQAKKKGIDASVISAYSFTPATSVKLIADNPADIRKVFGNQESK